MLRFFFRLGIVGLFLLSAADSSYLVLPLGNDLLLIALVIAGKSSFAWIGYVLVSAIGSIVGVLFVDVTMRKAGEKGLEHFFSPQKIEKFKRRIQDKAETLGATAGGSRPATNAPESSGRRRRCCSPPAPGTSCDTASRRSPPPGPRPCASPGTPGTRPAAGGPFGPPRR